MPGSDPAESLAVVLGEVPDLPFLPELPERGVGADMVGRTAGLLVDLHAEVQPSGWRICAAGGRDERRAQGWMSRDLDELEERLQGYVGWFKVQACGPWTLAASLELRYGDKMLADVGATRDLATSLAEGLAAHLIDLAGRVPGASWVVQLDEPSLPAVMVGQVPTASGFGALTAVTPEAVEAGLRIVVEALPPGAIAAVHCCARDVPVDTLVRAGADIVALDLELVGASRDQQLGRALEGGTRLVLGVLDPAVSRMSEVAGTVAPVRALGRRLGLVEQMVPLVALSPSCGLAGASPAGARTALGQVREAARRFAEDPHGEVT